MSNPMVSEPVTVTGAHGMELTVAVDCDAVKIGGVALGPAQQEEFAQVLVAAVWEAKANGEALRAEAAEVSGG